MAGERNLRSDETSSFSAPVDPAINAGGTNAAINVKEISPVAENAALKRRKLSL